MADLKLTRKDGWWELEYFRPGEVDMEALWDAAARGDNMEAVKILGSSGIDLPNFRIRRVAIIALPDDFAGRRNRIWVKK